jgi:hypothetical protein
LHADYDVLLLQQYRNTQKFILPEKDIRSVVSTDTAEKLCPPFEGDSTT